MTPTRQNAQSLAAGHRQWDDMTPDDMEDRFYAECQRKREREAEQIDKYDRETWRHLTNN
jgi:hypothetical protein